MCAATAAGFLTSRSLPPSRTGDATACSRLGGDLARKHRSPDLECRHGSTTCKHATHSSRPSPYAARWPPPPLLRRPRLPHRPIRIQYKPRSRQPRHSRTRCLPHPRRRQPLRAPEPCRNKRNCSVSNSGCATACNPTPEREDIHPPHRRPWVRSRRKPRLRQARVTELAARLATRRARGGLRGERGCTVVALGTLFSLMRPAGDCARS